MVRADRLLRVCVAVTSSGVLYAPLACRCIRCFGTRFGHGSVAWSFGGECAPHVGGCSSFLPTDEQTAGLMPVPSDLLLPIFHLSYGSPLGWLSQYSFNAPTERQCHHFALVIRPETCTSALNLDDKIDGIGSRTNVFDRAFRHAAIVRDRITSIGVQRGTFNLAISPFQLAPTKEVKYRSSSSMIDCVGHLLLVAKMTDGRLKRPISSASCQSWTQGPASHFTCKRRPQSVRRRPSFINAIRDKSLVLASDMRASDEYRNSLRLTNLRRKGQCTFPGPWSMFDGTSEHRIPSTITSLKVPGSLPIALSGYRHRSSMIEARTLLTFSTLRHP